MLIDNIEYELSKMSEGAFQKFVIALLFFEGYKFECPPGSTVGESKTSKGCPDALFKDDDKFVMCEITTQKSNLINKLKNDIKHSLSCEGITEKEISKIILAFNSKISVKDKNELDDCLKSKNIKLELYSVQKLAIIAEHFPSLSYYIPNLPSSPNIETLNVFLDKSEKGMQPSLCNNFFGREDDLKKTYEFISENDILVLYGKSGVGKSKLSTEIAKKCEYENDYQIIVVKYHSDNLINEIRKYIFSNHKFCVVFDDLNGNFKGYEHIIQDLLTIKNCKVKIIISIRDYFLNDLKFELNNYLNNILFYPLEPLSKKTISEIIENIIKDEHYIPDYQAIEVVSNFSKGNPRLAIMATKSLTDKNSKLNRISIYKHYFDNINHDISILNDFNYLQALGILSFFEVINKNNKSLINVFKKEFNINFDDLWEIYLRLFNLEFIDIFDNQIVKISNQTLANYVLYKMFFQERIIDFNDWVKIFAQDYSKRIRYVVIELSNSLGRENLNNPIQEFFYQESLQREQYNKDNLTFFEIFYIYFENQTLNFLINWKNSLEKDDTPFEKIEISSSETNFNENKELKLLSELYRLPKSTKKSLNLSLEIILKRHNFLPELAENLLKQFKFRRFDYRNNYKPQNDFIDFLITSTNENTKDLVLTKIFLAKAPIFFNWEHYHEVYEKPLEMSLYTIYLAKTNSLMKLREKILLHLFELYDKNPEKVLNGLEVYIRSVYRCEKNNITVYEDEKSLLINFFENSLNPNKIEDCMLIQNYINSLSKKKISIENLDDFLKSKSMKFLEIYITNNFIKPSKKEIEEDLKNKDMKYIKNIFLNLAKIKTLNGNINHLTISFIFEVLSKENPINLLNSLFFCIDKDLELNITANCFFKIFSFINNKRLIPVEKFYNLLNNTKNKSKFKFLYYFFISLNNEDITDNILDYFINFIKKTDSSMGFVSFKEFYKFNDKFMVKSGGFTDSFSHSNIITYITDIILHYNTKRSLENLPIFEWDFCQNNGKYFKNRDIKLLNEVFFILLKQHPDWDHTNDLKVLINEDNSFLLEYVKTTMGNDDYLYKSSEVNLSFIWDNNNLKEYIIKSVDWLINQKGYVSNFEHPLSILFEDFNNEQEEKVKNFLYNLLKENLDKGKYVSAIMNVFLYYFNKDFITFLKEFLQLNSDIKIFKKISLFKMEASFGSIIDKLQKEIQFYQKILDMVNSLESNDYNEHINYLNSIILRNKNNIKIEEKRKFEKLWM